MAALRFSAVNTALGVLNLLPIPGLDGAQALEDGLALLLGWEKGARVHAVLMKIFCLAGAGMCGWRLAASGFRLPLACFGLAFVAGLVRETY